MKVIYDSLALGAVIKFGESEFELRGGLGNLIQTAELTGNERRAGDIPAEVHGVEVGGCLTVFSVRAICYIMPK